MTFTAKEDYGLRAMLDIAANGARGPVQAREIANRQHVPEQFLEQLLSSLRRAELIRSIRGAGGGYALSVPADQLSVGSIFRALTGPLVPPDLIAPLEIDSAETVVIRSVWDEIRESMRAVADRTTLADLLHRRNQSGEVFHAMHI